MEPALWPAPRRIELLHHAAAAQPQPSQAGIFIQDKKQTGAATGFL